MSSDVGYTFHRVSEHEANLMKKLHAEGSGVRSIAARLDRSTDTVSKHVFKKNLRGGPLVHGRPQLIDDHLFKKIMAKYEDMLGKASRNGSGPQEVSIAMLKKTMKLNMDEKTISRAFWNREVYLRPLYEKILLSPADINERNVFGVDNKNRTPYGWNNFAHASIDNKNFPVYLTGKHRHYASRRRIRGNYRTKSSKLTGKYIKPSASLKFNTGAANAVITCAIGAGKVLMWHVTPGRWNGSAAARMYSGPLKKALQKAWPNVRGARRVLEDNDPTGYKSNLGLKAKANNGIQTMDLPKRSPDLSPLDYSVWAEISRRMRRQEKTWPASKTETRAAYLARLRRTAMSLPSTYIEKVIGDLHKRCAKLVAAKGGHFIEGGHDGLL